MAARCGALSCFVLFVFFLLCLVDPVRHCEEGTFFCVDFVLVCGMCTMHHVLFALPLGVISTQLAFYVNLHRAVIGPSATLTGR